MVRWGGGAAPKTKPRGASWRERERAPFSEVLAARRGTGTQTEGHGSHWRPRGTGPVAAGYGYRSGGSQTRGGRAERCLQGDTGTRRCLGGCGGGKEEAGQPGRPAQWTPRFVVQPAQGGGQDCGPSPPQGPPRPASPSRPGLPQTLPDGPCPRQQGLCFEWKLVWRGLGASSLSLLACEGHRCGPRPGLRRIRPATPDTLPLLAQSRP